jgi:hypothetical protein
VQQYGSGMKKSVLRSVWPPPISVAFFSESSITSQSLYNGINRTQYQNFKRAQTGTHFRGHNCH